MFNNIKQIDKAFRKVYEIEKKINYEFEPIYDRENKNWKRNLFYKELKKDFVKDVTEFGFYPYLPKACEEQQKIKNISKISKIDNFSKLDYLKSLYKQVNPEDIDKENSNLNDSYKTLNKGYSMSMRIKRNKYKSILAPEYRKNKKIFLLKQTSNLRIPKIEIKKPDKKFFEKKNFKKNSSMVNICFKKDKNSSQSENEFIDAESFIYEPKKLIYKYSQHYSREEDSSENDSNLQKTKSILNNISKKANSKTIEQKSPGHMNSKLKAMHYLNKSKGTLTTRNRNNNNFNVIENIWNKKNNKNILLNKNKKIKSLFKNDKIRESTPIEQNYRLLAFSRKMKYG
jgi:hypothetical protein